MKIRISPLLFVIAIFCVSLNYTKAQNPVRIMPLGNSITEGWTDGSLPDNQMIGYRFALKQLLDNAGYITDFVGSQSDGSLYFDDCQHGGISGTRDNYLARMLVDSYDERWGEQLLTPAQPYLDAFMPDIILLEVGTNDILHENEETDIDYPDCIVRQKISLILDRIDEYEVRTGKECIVFLALIINRRQPCFAGSGCSRTSEFNAAIETMALTRIANGDKIVIVDMENDAGFTYISGDDMSSTDVTGLHPNNTGYTKMANLWFSKIQSNYNTKPVITSIPDNSASEGNYLPVIDLDNYVSDFEDTDAELNWTASQIGGSNLTISINPSNHTTSIKATDSQWNGKQKVIFTVTDLGNNGKYSKSASDTVEFTITESQDPPVIKEQSALAVDEDNSITLSLSNFTIVDPDSPPESFQLSVLPGANYTVNGLSVKPTTNFNGQLTVTVKVSDNSLSGPEYPALITVNAVNDKPVYSGQPAISFNEDTWLKVLVSSLTVSDVDNNISQLSIVMKNGANYTISGDTVYPSHNYNGTIQVESFIQDPQGAKSNTFYLTMAINSVDDAPIFTTSPQTEIKLNSPYIYLFNASDPDIEDMVTMSVMQKPDWLDYYDGSFLLAGIAKKTGQQQVIIRATDGLINVDQEFLINVTTTDIVDYQEGAEKFTLYPNPASDAFSISGLPTDGKINFRIYDLVGNVLYNEDFSDNTSGIIYINNLNMLNGIYFYLIEVDNTLYSGKFSIVN